MESKIFLYQLNQIKEKYENDATFYMCNRLSSLIYGEPSTNRVFEDHPEFTEWVIRVGKSYRYDYELGDAWTFDDREGDMEYCEDEIDEDGEWVFPFLTSSVKAKEIGLFLKEQGYENI